jgi:hypothetical protein
MGVMKNTIITILVLALIGFGIYYFVNKPKTAPVVPSDTTETTNNTASTTPVVKEEGAETVIGKSVGNKDIVAYNYGTGDKRVLFVGGIHGGYSWNTSLVAFELMDYLKANPSAVPAGVKVTVIPNLNPDGLSKVVATTNGRFTKADVTLPQSSLVAGRFNTNNVDLSRNFDCNWKSVGVWQTKPVSGGASVFSESESLAFKNYVESHKLSAVVVWYSAAGGVYSSECGNGILPETAVISSLYAKASGYPAYDSFDFYETTGDVVNWLAKINIPAISVLLTTHQDTEWTKNQKGVAALLSHYAK